MDIFNYILTAHMKVLIDCTCVALYIKGVVGATPELQSATPRCSSATPKPKPLLI